jgi:uncharacterized protein DUF4154
MRTTMTGRACVGLLAALLVAAAERSPRGQSAPEAQVKAAFLYNFAKFVEWPAGAFGDAGAPLVIGVVGKDPLGRDLDNIVRGRTAGGHPIVVQRYATGAVPSGHIVFVSASERSRLRETLDSLKREPILTVSDLDGFTDVGGMIRMFAADGEIKLDINVERASGAGLQLSSKLLSAATTIHGQTRGR